VIGFLVAGFVVGAIARVVKPGEGNLDLLATLGLGIMGSLVGGLVARSFGKGRLFELDVIGCVLAVVVAVLFIGVAESRVVRSKSSA
jgi:uncharacterized membrane protein YeaQ/YmgE (transglycosylase-associated protein family)